MIQSESIISIFWAKVSHGRPGILNILNAYKREVSDAYPILKIGIFGSVARHGGKEDRDVDIVACTDFMNPFLKKRIDRGAVYA